MFNLQQSIKPLLATLALSFATISSVQAAEPTANYTEFKLKVDSIVSTANGAYIYFDSVHQCGSKRAYIPSTNANFKQLYSTLVYAQGSNTLVAADLQDTTPGASCNGNYSNIGNICVGAADSTCFIGW